MYVSYIHILIYLSFAGRYINRGTQQIVSVNYLFGKPFIPYNFLKGILTSNFIDMGNLRPSVFGLTKMSFRVPKKGQLRFSGNGQRCPSNFEKTHVALE